MKRVYYDVELNRNGAHFFIFKDNHSKEILEKAKALIRRDHDVTGISLAKGKKCNFIKNHYFLDIGESV